MRHPYPAHEATPDTQDAVRNGEANCNECGWPIHPWWVMVGERRTIADMRWRHTSIRGMSYRRHPASVT